MITIKPETLLRIASAAMLWYLENTDDHNRKLFNSDRAKCAEIQRKIRFVAWDEDAELYIDEVPF